MSNDITGDYDIVAQFSTDSISRILAAMHCGQRFPHSLSMLVDDLPISKLGIRAASIVDKFGKAVTDWRRVKLASAPSVSTGPLSEEMIRTVDPIVNWHSDLSSMESNQAQASSALRVSSIVPSDSSFMAGIAQLQLGPPIIALIPGQPSTAQVHMLAMIRYHANDDTLPLSEFMRGDVITTFGVGLQPSSNGSEVVVTPTAIHFNPLWSETPLSANDNAAIDKALAKSLKQSFQRSSTPVPANVYNLAFKGLARPDVVCAMMNAVPNNAASPDSVQNIWLDIYRSPDFVLAFNAQTIVPPLTAAVNAAIDPVRQQHLDTTVTVNYWLGTYTFHIYTNITVLNATVTLGDDPTLDSPGLPGTGQITLQVPVQVRFGWKDKPFFVPDPVDFDFGMTQLFTLTLNGRNVGIQRLGDVVLSIPNNIPSDEKNTATAQAKAFFDNVWNSQQAQIQQQINQALSADTLQSFIKSLMNPKTDSASSVIKAVLGSPQRTSGAPQEIDPDLEYIYYHITPEAIRLLGTLSVPPWPAADVEFEKDPWAQAALPEYRALNSWIPGGIVEQYQWDFTGAGVVTDANRFVTVNAPPLIAVSNQVCLTITGQRLTNAGPISYETVTSRRMCQLTSIPLGAWRSKEPDLSLNRPRVILPARVPVSGSAAARGIQVLAHASPWVPADMGGGTANFLIHLPANSSEEAFLVKALAQSGRTDTTTAVVCVLTPEQLRSSVRSPHILYADDSAAWEKLIGINQRPATAILDPRGDIAWRHQGKMSQDELASVLRDRLAAGGQFFPQFLESPVRRGQVAPNFFLGDPGTSAETLRSLAGRPVALIFSRNDDSRLISVMKALRETARENVMIVGIEDGGEPKSSNGNSLGDAVFVGDPDRQISQAYGIHIWPTLVLLDPRGMVMDVKLGLASLSDLNPWVSTKSPA